MDPSEGKSSMLESYSVGNRMWDEQAKVQCCSFQPGQHPRRTNKMGNQRNKSLVCGFNLQIYISPLPTIIKIGVGGEFTLHPSEPFNFIQRLLGQAGPISFLSTRKGKLSACSSLIHSAPFFSYRLCLQTQVDSAPCAAAGETPQVTSTEYASALPGQSSCLVGRHFWI
jgi:hypothetical protein